MTKSKHDAPIRNLGAFLKSYVKSESFQRALNRQPRMIERTEKNSKGHLVTFREYAGHNQLAVAFNAAVNGA